MAALTESGHSKTTICRTSVLKDRKTHKRTGSLFDHLLHVGMQVTNMLQLHGADAAGFSCYLVQLLIFNLGQKRALQKTLPAHASLICLLKSMEIILPRIIIRSCKFCKQAVRRPVVPVNSGCLKENKNKRINSKIIYFIILYALDLCCYWLLNSSFIYVYVNTIDFCFLLLVFIDP